MKTTLTLYVLRHLTDPDFTVKASGRSLDDAIENCSGGAEKWEHVSTEEVPYKHASLIAAIVSALPGSWTGEPQSIEHADCNWYLVRDDGLRLFVSMPIYGHKHKLEISASPDRLSGRWVDVYADGKRLSAPKIGVSEIKAPTQIAKDITRRLLSDSENYNAAVLATIAQHRDSESKQLATYRALCELFGTTTREQSQGTRNTIVHYGAGTCEVNPGGSVSFKLYSVPADKALAITKALAKIVAN